MKFNLKNFPRQEFDGLEDAKHSASANNLWIEGFEAELREDMKLIQSASNSYHAGYRDCIREILGE